MERFSKDKENSAAIRFIRGYQTHSDIGQALEASGRRFEGVEVDSSYGRKPLPAMGLLFQGNFFGLARGMQNITLRLSADRAYLLTTYGAILEPELGFPGWVSFSPFHSRINVERWVEEAFNHSSI